jgi:anthranilate synthase component 1
MNSLLSSAKTVTLSQGFNPGQLDPMAVLRQAQASGRDVFFYEASPEIGLTPEYAVIGLGPFKILRQRADKTELVLGDQVLALHMPFFAALAEVVQSLQSQSSGAFPFQNGGLFGIIGYDSVVNLEPKLRDKAYFQYDHKFNRRNFNYGQGCGYDRSCNEGIHSELRLAQTLFVFDHRSQMVHLVDTLPGANIPLMQNLLRLSIQSRAVQKAAMPANPQAIANPQTPTKRFIDKISEGASLGPLRFFHGMEKIKNHIRNGDIFQAVLAERFESQVRASAINIFASLRRRGQAPYNFFFSKKDHAFFGASPESLVLVKDRRLLSHPIAGTRPRGSSPQLDKIQERSLRRSRKEGAEHLMLVDLARNDLGRVAAPGSVKVNTFRSLKKFSHVMHLVSEVSAYLAEGKTAVDALAACFPAGTLSGAPKVRAMEILADIEPAHRGFYGGAVVAFDGQGGLSSCIAIRAAEMKGQKIVLRAGAGIVADSKPQQEYQEILSKIAGLCQAIDEAIDETLDETMDETTDEATDEAEFLYLSEYIESQKLEKAHVSSHR